MAGLTLPGAPPAYSMRDQASVRKALQEADLENIKTRRDVYLVQGERLIMKDTVTGTSYAITVASGALVLTAV